MYKPTCERRCAPSVDYFCYPHSVPRVTFPKSERTGCAISRPHLGLLAHYCRPDLPSKHMSPEGPQRTWAGPELPKSSLRISVQVLKSSVPAPPEPPGSPLSTPPPIDCQHKQSVTEMQASACSRQLPWTVVSPKMLTLRL